MWPRGLRVTCSDLFGPANPGRRIGDLWRPFTGYEAGSTETWRLYRGRVGWTLCLISGSGVAMAKSVGRWECSVVGSVSEEPIGDRDGHRLVSFQYSCFGVDGPLKDTVYTASAISEWDGPQGKYLSAGGIVRAVGGLAVTQVTDATASVVMKDGKPAASEASGKAQFTFASGTLAALSGKPVKFETKPIGAGRFGIEVTIDDEPGAVQARRA